MNPQEHKLLILMFARQAMLIKTMADILRSHGILSDEDARLFDEYGQTEAPALHVLRRTAELYSQVATTLGLDVPIEGLEK